MANSKISQLPTATTITGTEIIPIVQGGATKQATVAQITAQGSGLAFQYTQSVAASVWMISHTFGRRPNVELFTLAGERIFTDVTAADTSTVTVSFPSPATGYAVLS